MMSKYFTCCTECFDSIGRRSTRASRLWMDLCADTMTHGAILNMRTLDFPELRTLEKLGYLVSTDKEHTLGVRLNGYMKSEDHQHFFCIKEGRHE